MTVLGSTCPYYGGVQVQNPANVIATSGAPSANLKAKNGTLAVDNASATMYGAVSQSGGIVTWAVLGGSTSAVNSVTGTTNQILANPTTGAVILSLVGPYTPATYTAHGVLLGEGTSSIVAVSPSATAGVALVSAGAAADPAYGTVVVAGGGTGLTTLTAHSLYVGNGSSPPNAVANGTTGQVLTAVTGADPTFQAPAASSISVTGNSGGALTGNAFTFTGGTTGLSFAGAGSTETLGGTLVVGNGGTGLATLTAHALYAGNGSSAPNAISVGATGTLLAGATGADPAFTASPSITGNYIGTTAGNGFQFNANAASGVAASPVVLDSRAGQATFTTVSIAAAADLTLTLTNSAITGAGTQIIYSMSGATTGAALSVKSVTPGSGTVAFVITNGTGATTSTADIVINFLVVN